MIHLVGGESALGTLKETSVPGEKFSIDDILMEGPVLDGLRSESSWNARADYLDRYFSIPKFAYLSGNAERNRVLHESLKQRPAGNRSISTIQRLSAATAGSCFTGTP